MGKYKLRKMIKNKLMEMSEEEYQHLSKEIHMQLYTLAVWKQAKTIAMTVSRAREVNTYPLIERAWDENKRVVVPKCDPKKNTMEFREICSFQQLEQVYFGLKEPIVSKTMLVKKDNIDLIIVPGVCFDKVGYRIGYGGGYYDRYLTNYNQGTLSLAFSSQLLDIVPREEHDIPVNMIITEHGVVK